MKNRAIWAVLLIGLVAFIAWAQNPPAAPPAAPQTPPVPASTQTATPTQQASLPIDKNAAEVSSHETAIAVTSPVTLVQVPVIVRDRSGKVIGTLKKEDFQLFDKGKAQEIIKFSVEKNEGKP